MTYRLFLAHTQKIFNGRFFYLLVTQFILFAIYPFLNYSGKSGTVLFEVLYLAILLASLRVVIHDRKSLRNTIGVLLLLSITMRMLDEYFVNRVLFASSLLIDTVFHLVISIVILRYVFKTGHVTTDKILGAICVYIFIGILFTQVFALIELFIPNSYDVAERLINNAVDQPMSARNDLFLYFSFITLTTVGYGDIVPITQPAASFAIMEAVVGQIYLTVLIARLVGLHIAYARVSYADDE